MHRVLLVVAALLLLLPPLHPPLLPNHLPPFKLLPLLLLLLPHRLPPVPGHHSLPQIQRSGALWHKRHEAFRKLRRALLQAVALRLPQDSLKLALNKHRGRSTLHLRPLKT